MYWDLTSKLSESSLRCLGGLGLLFWLARSLVETELDRDISLPSSVSAANSYIRTTLEAEVVSIPGVTSPVFSSFPNIRSLALL